MPPTKNFEKFNTMEQSGGWGSGETIAASTTNPKQTVKIKLMKRGRSTVVKLSILKTGCIH